MASAPPMRPFLSVYEMAGGPRAEADAHAQQAASLALSNFQTQQKMMNEAKASAEQDTIQQAMANAFKPVAQSTEQTPVVAPVEQVSSIQNTEVPVQEAASIQAPTVGQIAPVKKDETSGEQGRLEQVPEQVAAASTQAPVQAPVPEQVAAASTQAPVQAPVQAPAPEQVAQAKVQQARSMPTIAGIPNYLADDVFNKRVQVVQDLVQSGKISPQTGDAYVNTMAATREKRLKDIADVHAKFAEIDEKKINTESKRIEIAAKARDAIDNMHNDILKAYKSGDINYAKQVANEYQAVIDFNDPKAITQLETRAKRSSDYKLEQEENRKAAKDEREATELKPVPGVAGAFYNPKGKIVDADGKTLSQREVNALDLQGKRAGATTVSVNNSPVTGEAIPKGAVPLKGIKADDQIKAGENLESSRQVIEDAMRMKQLYPKVVAASGIDPTDSQFKAKFKTWLNANWDNNDATREYRSRSQRMVNSNLRLNKGAQTEGDAQRERDALASADMPPTAHNAMLDSIIKRSTRQAKNNQNVQRGYIMPGSDEDNQPTESSGFESFAVPGTGKAPKTQTAAPKLGALPKVKSRGEGYDAIPPGSQYIGPDGKMYVKGNK